MKELYIFDFDGTLVDSYRDSIKFFNITLKEYSLPTFDKEVEGLDYEVFRQFLHKQIEGIEEEFMKSFTDQYKDAPQTNTYPYKGIIQVLEKLQKDNISLAICSNRQQDNLKILVEKLFENINFKYIMGTYDEKHLKPEPYMINQILKKENIKKENVLFFGDKIADIKACENAGIDIVHVMYGQGNQEAINHPYPLKHIDTVEEILEFH